MQRKHATLPFLLSLSVIASSPAAQIGFEHKAEYSIPRYFEPHTSPWGTFRTIVGFTADEIQTVRIGAGYGLISDPENLPVLYVPPGEPRRTALGDPNASDIPWLVLSDEITPPTLFQGAAAPGFFTNVGVVGSGSGGPLAAADLHHANFAPLAGTSPIVGAEDLLLVYEDTAELWINDGFGTFGFELDVALPDEGYHQDSVLLDLGADTLIDKVAILHEFPARIHIYDFDLATGFTNEMTLVPLAALGGSAIELEAITIGGTVHLVMHLVGGAATAELFELRSTGDFAWRQAVPLPTSSTRSRALQVADMDGDGLEDLLVAGPDTAILYQVPGPALFGSAQAIGLPSASILADDFDLDGRMDLVLTSVTTGPGSPAVTILEQRDAFVRGDYNGDGLVNATDFNPMGTWILGTGPPPTCEDVGDFNDDGSLGLADVIALGEYVFNGGPPPAFPFPEPGGDPTPDMYECP